MLSLAEAGFFRPRWSSGIIEELSETLERNFGQELANRSISRIIEAFPESMIEGDFSDSVGLGLPDRNDNHILAAAIAVRAAQIVTDNIKHFPSDHLDRFDIEAVTADEFISNTIALDHIAAARAFRTMRERFKRPSVDGSELLSLMEKRGLVESASELSDYVSLI